MISVEFEHNGNYSHIDSNDPIVISQWLVERIMAVSPGQHSDIAMPDEQAIWRTGRSVGRTIYVGDRLIGVMDTRELAAEACEAHNARLGGDTMAAPPAMNEDDKAR